MKREQRVLAIAGDRQVVVSVLFRGKLWFESLEVRVLDGKGKGDEVFKSRYLDQARTVLVDEGLLRGFEADVEKTFLDVSKKRGVEIIVVKEKKGDDVLISHEKIKRLCVQGDVPEALRVARRIFYEIRNIISRTV